MRLTLQGTLALDYFTLLSTDMQIKLLGRYSKEYARYLTLTEIAITAVSRPDPT